MDERSLLLRDHLRGFFTQLDHWNSAILREIRRLKGEVVDSVVDLVAVGLQLACVIGHFLVWELCCIPADPDFILDTLLKIASFINVFIAISRP